MARYTGAWARQATQWYGEDERFTVSGPTDAAHGDKSEAPAPLMMDAPQLPAGGEIYSDVMWEAGGLPPSTVIDRTPISGHGNPQDSGHGFGGNTNPLATVTELARERGLETGADDRATKSTVVYWFNDDDPYGYFTQGFEDVPIDNLPNNPALIRGINGYAANDGESGRPWAWSVESQSWHIGDYESSNIQRGRFHPPRRTHGEVKMVEPDIATIISDAPPPDKPDTYANPFSTLQKFMPKFRRVRGIRREPGPWDEQLQAQEVTERATNYADGMMVL